MDMEIKRSVNDKTNRERLLEMSEYDLLCALQDLEFRSHGGCILRNMELIWSNGRGRSGYGVMDSECEIRKSGHIPNIERGWIESCKACISKWLNKGV